MLISRVPGGGANHNGPLTGQIQYRGMFGPRINVRIDGMLIHGGGPNWMAPPLHHIPSALMDDLVGRTGHRLHLDRRRYRRRRHGKLETPRIQ